MSPKKILIFSTAYLPFIGGAELSVKAITDRLGDEIKFDLITARLSKNLPEVDTIGKVKIYRIGWGIPFIDKFVVPFLGAVKTLRLQKDNNYVAYWCIMATFASGAAYIANWFQKRVPIILTLQEGDSERWLRYRWLGMLDLSWRLALRHTDYLTAISNYLIDRAKRLGYRGYGFVIPNGVDIKKFENQNEHVKGVIRVKTLKLKPEDICLITTSRLTEKNAVDDIIESLQFLEDKFVLLILGTGNLEKTLKQKVSALKLEDRVKFLGLQSPSGVITYLHDSDIFVRPSRSEGLGNSFIEAMAAGIPVIATRVGGIPDFLIDRETGLFCEVNNPKSIAEKVMEYYRDPGLKSKIVRQAREMVEKRYDWDLIAKRMKVEIFDTVELCEY